MQFSVIHLLLLLASWPVAFALAPHLKFQRVRVHSGVASTKNRINSVKYIANELYRDGKLTHANLVNRPGHPNPWSPTDSWGNPLQFVYDESGELAVDGGAILAYSFGQDGKSKSKGNDPDDINSWDDHDIPFYRNQIQNFKRRKRLWCTLWVTPLVFGGLLIGKQLLWFVFPRSAV